MAAPLCAEPSDGFVAWEKISGCSTDDRTKLMMKKLLTVVPMAMAFIAAGAISSFCANVASEVSDLSRLPLSGVHTFARESAPRDPGASGVRTRHRDTQSAERPEHARFRRYA